MKEECLVIGEKNQMQRDAILPYELEPNPFEESFSKTMHDACLNIERQTHYQLQHQHQQQQQQQVHLLQVFYQTLYAMHKPRPPLHNLSSSTTLNPLLSYHAPSLSQRLHHQQLGQHQYPGRFAFIDLSPSCVATQGLKPSAQQLQQQQQLQLQQLQQENHLQCSIRQLPINHNSNKVRQLQRQTSTKRTARHGKFPFRCLYLLKTPQQTQQFKPSQANHSRIRQMCPPSKRQ